MKREKESKEEERRKKKECKRERSNERGIMDNGDRNQGERE